MARKIIALVLAALMLAVSGCSGQLTEEIGRASCRERV